MLSVYTACVNKFDRLSDYPKLYLGLEAVNTPRIQPYLQVDTCKRTGHLYTNQEQYLTVSGSAFDITVILRCWQGW